MNYGKLTDSERAAHNAAVLNTVTVIQSVIDAYKPALKNWRAEYGSKPTDAMLMAATLLFSKHQKPGVETFGGALLLRPEGCVSGSEYQLAAVPLTGKSVGPMNNKRKALVQGKLFHETAVGKPARYWLTFMPAGEKQLAAFNAAHVQAVTPNATAPVKAKKAKAKKAKPVITTADTGEAAEAAAAPANDGSVLIPAAVDTATADTATN